LPYRLSRKLNHNQRLGFTLFLSVIVWFGLGYGGLELIEYIKSEEVVMLKTDAIGAISFGVYFVVAVIFVTVPPLPVGCSCLNLKID
jgi:hypothetical protein